MEVIRQVGAIAGLAAFFGLAVLALLYFAQARDVRRLRESASFLVEGEEDGGQAVQAADRAAAAAAVTAQEPEQAAAAAAATAPDEREAFRRAELARQAAKRRQRFEQRRKPGGPQRPAWLSDGPSTAVVAVGALLLVAGLIFGATRLIGGEDDATRGTNATGEKGSKAAPAKVAVLNGTAEAGLASEAAAPLKQSGFQTGPVTNTEEPFDTSVVMFDPNAQGSEETAREVAQVAGIQGVEPMTTEIRGVSEGATVALVLGEDQASGSSLEGTDTTSGVEGI